MPPLKTFGLTVAAALILLLTWRLGRNLRRTSHRSDATVPASAVPVVRLYRKATSRLAQRGLPRRPSETPLEFSERIARNDVRGAEALRRLTELYGAAYYGGRSVDADVLDDLARRLMDLGKPDPAQGSAGKPRAGAPDA